MAVILSSRSARPTRCATTGGQKEWNSTIWTARPQHCSLTSVDVDPAENVPPPPPLPPPPQPLPRTKPSFPELTHRYLSNIADILQKISNSSPPSVVYMRQWILSALLQIMACRLRGTKPLSNPMLGYCQLDKLQWNLNQNTKLFIHENASENVICVMAAILSKGRWVYVKG